jgi:hypothetical protein
MFNLKGFQKSNLMSRRHEITVSDEATDNQKKKEFEFWWIFAARHLNHFLEQADPFSPLQMI